MQWVVEDLPAAVVDEIVVVVAADAAEIEACDGVDQAVAAACETCTPSAEPLHTVTKLL